jgi:Domain of unknown function (DUF1707)
MNPELRIGDAERESAVVALGEHYAAGRLNKDEFDERTAVALTAPTHSALAPLFLDLPAPHAAGPAVSTTHATARPHPSWAPIRTPHRRGWHPIPLLPVIVLLVALRVADLIPWLVFAIVIWFWCFGRFHRPQRHIWHQSPRH